MCLTPCSQGLLIKDEIGPTFIFGHNFRFHHDRDYRDLPSHSLGLQPNILF